MRTQLQLKLPITLGILLLCGHSLLVFGLWRVSLRNIEIGVMWEHMRLTDLPVSMLLDWYYDAHRKIFVQDNYPNSEFFFHMIFGGLQFFVWGWLLGMAWNRLRFRLRIKHSGSGREEQ